MIRRSAPRARISKTTFEGGPAMEIATAHARLILPTGFGPRIGHFGRPTGRNLLFWDRAREYGRGAWPIRGGHRVWVTRPLGDESEETYVLDDAPCEVEEEGGGLRVTGAEEPISHIRRSIAVRPLDADTFSVVSRVENCGGMLWSGGVWAITCTRPGRDTRYGIPLGDGTDWDVFNLIIPRRWGGHTSSVNDPQIQLTEGCMVLSSRGVETKRMVEAPQGIIGMTEPRQRLSFVKKVAFQRGARYPLGTNIAFYVGPGNFMVEMETMAPEQTVRPGEAIESEEIWALRPPIDWRRLEPGHKVL
jgi:hypothetical protein